jgi:hypothetical protein
MPKKLFRTPTTLPEATQCRGLVMPASQEWLGLFAGALLEATHAWNYDQVESTDLTPEETAAKCYEIFTAWLDSECGGGGGPEECPAVALPTGQKIYRTSPTTGNWEVLDPVDGETWSEPTGEDAIPTPDARPEATEPEQECGAASNVVNALHDLYDAIVTFYDDEVEDWENQAEVAAQIAISVGSAFGPISATFLTLGGAAWEAFKLILAELTTDDWTPEFTEILTCIFKKHVELVDGVPTWNVSTVAADLVGFILPVIDIHVRVRWQVWYLMQCIGAQGLTAAASRTDVEGECATCDEWCYTATPLAFGATNEEGYYDSNGYLWSLNTYDAGWASNARLVVDTSQCVITRVGMTLVANGAETQYRKITATNVTDQLTISFGYLGTTGFPIEVITPDSVDAHSTGEESSFLFQAGTFDGNRNSRIVALTFMGTGINPFGIGSNC